MNSGKSIGPPPAEAVKDFFLNSNDVHNFVANYGDDNQRDQVRDLCYITNPYCIMQKHIVNNSTMVRL